MHSGENRTPTPIPHENDRSRPIGLKPRRPLGDVTNYFKPDGSVDARRMVSGF